MDNGHPKDLDAVLEKVKDSKYTTVVCLFYVQKCPPFFPSLKGSFPLAEWNKISGFFPTRHLGIGHVTLRTAVVFVVSAIPDFPTHPPLEFSLYTVLV